MKSLGRSIGGKVAIALLVLVAAIGVGAFAAWRMLSNRTGEAAIQLIPSDAGMVFTFDTAPSGPSQAAMFKRIGDEMESKGLMAKLDKMLESGMLKSPLAKEIRPFCTKSFAFTMWVNDPKMRSAPPMAILIAVTDSGAVQSILAKNGTAASDAGSKGYKLPDNDSYAAVISGYLVLADKADVLARIEKTASGGSPSLASSPEYSEARKALPSDANMMFFMSPGCIKALQQVQGAKTFYSGMSWVAFSLSVREEGLSFDCQYPSDLKGDSMLAALSKVKPVAADLLKHLPAGAYGIGAVSEPSAYWTMIQSAVKETPMGGSAVTEGIAKFEKDTGLNIEKDILPVLSGNLTFAVYPANAGKSVDFVMEITGNEQSNPADLAAKLRTLAERESGKKGNTPMRFTSHVSGKATIWALDEPSRKLFVQSMSETSAEHRKRVGSASASQENNGPQPGMPGGSTMPQMNRRETMNAEPQFNPGQPNPMKDAVKDMTLAYAVVDKTLILGSSETALNTALDTYLSQTKSLAEDPNYADMQRRLVPGSQYYFMADFGKIMAAVRPMLDKALASSGEWKADDILGIFGDGKHGYVASASFDGKLFKGSAMLPFDCVKFVDLIAKAMDSANQAARRRPSMAPGPM